MAGVLATLVAIMRWDGPTVTNSVGQTLLKQGLTTGKYLGIVRGKHYVAIQDTHYWFEHMRSWTVVGWD